MNNSLVSAFTWQAVRAARDDLSTVIIGILVGEEPASLLSSFEGCHEGWACIAAVRGLGADFALAARSVQEHERTALLELLFASIALLPHAPLPEAESLATDLATTQALQLLGVTARFPMRDGFDAFSHPDWHSASELAQGAYALAAPLVVVPDELRFQESDLVKGVAYFMLRQRPIAASRLLRWLGREPVAVETALVTRQVTSQLSMVHGSSGEVALNLRIAGMVRS